MGKVKKVTKLEATKLWMPDCVGCGQSNLKKIGESPRKSGANAGLDGCRAACPNLDAKQLHAEYASVLVAMYREERKLNQVRQARVPMICGMPEVGKRRAGKGETESRMLVRSIERQKN